MRMWNAISGGNGKLVWCRFLFTQELIFVRLDDYSVCVCSCRFFCFKAFLRAKKEHADTLPVSMWREN